MMFVESKSDFHKGPDIIDQHDEHFDFDDIETLKKGLPFMERESSKEILSDNDDIET